MSNNTHMSEQVTGAAPLNTSSSDERARAAAVERMFSSIAPRYDLLNHLLSFNIDRLWWRYTACAFAPILQRPGTRILDLCCGTGDMTFALCKVRDGLISGQRFSRTRSGRKSAIKNDVASLPAEIIGADFSAAMLARAREKSQGIPNPPQWLEADALAIPLPDADIDLVVSAFGFRNLANYDRGLREIARVLKPGGQVGILDFGRPSGVFGTLYDFYFRHVLPRLGTLISGVRGPYHYLPQSVERFPAPEEMLQRMRAAGFMNPTWTRYTAGIAGLFRGTRA